jgi:hypothetical protein
MLTAAQKADIRYYLGYATRFHDGDQNLESAMDAIANDPEGEALVVATITDIKAIDTKLESAWDRLKAVQVCEIKLGHKEELCALRSEGRRLVSRVAASFGVPVRHDAFGSAPFNVTADWFGTGYQGGNEIKQG